MISLLFKKMHSFSDFRYLNKFEFVNAISS